MSAWDELSNPQISAERRAVRVTITDQCKRRGWTSRADIIALTDVAEHDTPEAIIDALALWAERNPGIVPTALNLDILLHPVDATGIVASIKANLPARTEQDPTE